MALEKKLIGLPIAKGQNEKFSERTIPLGQFEEAKNLQFLKAGEASKRKGFHSISNDIPAIVASDGDRTVDTGKAVAAYNDEIIAFDGRYAYTKTTTDSDWVNKGTVVGCTLENDYVEAGTSIVQTNAQIGQANNFEVHVWSEVDPTEVMKISDREAATFTSVTPEAPTTIGAYNQTVGSGLSDVTITGTFTGTARRLYEVVIEDDSTSPELWKWRYQDDGGAWSSFSTGHNAGFPRTLNLGVTFKFEAQTGHTNNDTWQFYGGYGSVQINGATDHNLSKGSRVAMAFAHADWPDADFTVSGVSSTSVFTLDFAQQPAPDAATAGTVTLASGEIYGVVWRTYAKVIDKTTRTEVIAKTLVNQFVTANGIYNIPRAQVAVSGQYVFIFVHVGSGRIKYTKVDTGAGTGAISANLKPALLINNSSDVLFDIDPVNPVWCVEAVNNSSISNGICVLRTIQDSGLKLRLSYYGNSGGTLSESSVDGSPVSITTVQHFPPANEAGAPTTSTTEAYAGTSSKHTMEIVGDLMLKVITPTDSLTGDYIAIGYTASNDMTAAGLNRGGTADEPDGIRLRVYNAALALQGAEQEIALTKGADSVSTDFANTGAPGYILVNGTAGKNGVKVRFFLTMVANKTNFYARSPEFLVNAYDYQLTGGGGITDIDLDFFGMTITSDCFAHNRDLYLGVTHATRPNTVGGSGNLAHSVFNTSVGLIINHQGEVVAKTSIGAGPWAQEINFRFMQFMGYNRINVTYGVPRVVAESSSEVLTGSIDPAASTTVTGVGTLFDTELAIGDLITVSGETRQVTAIASSSSLTVSTAFSNNANDTSPEKYVATKFRFGTSRYSGVNTSSDGTDLTAMDAAVGTMDFAPVRYLPSVQANGALKVAGGILWDYSGDYFKEDNFYYYPELHSMDVGSGTGLTGSFSYKAIYEWVDHNGKVQRSNPSGPIITGDIANKAPNIRCYGLHMTYKRDATALLNPGGYAAANWGARSEVKLVLYRTVDEGSVYHRCAESLMDYSDRYMTFADSLSDADLQDNPVLYTTGGVVGNISPPSQYDIALWKDRVFLATTENTVWFSKRFSEGDETGFSDSFIRSVDNRAEKIRAICPNLEHMLIFGARNGYYMSGDGPSGTGAGPGFSPLRIFAPGQGAIDGTCRVESPLGVFFQTPQGLMLCGRNMRVEHKGANVEDQITSTNYVIDGHVFDKEHEVRFLLAANKKIAVYNYLFDQWSYWDLHSHTGINAASIVVDNSYYRLNISGILYEQQTDTYYDKVVTTDKSYNFQLKTGWINVGQLQQFGRVYRLLMLGDFNTASLPYVLFYSDYSTTHDEQITYPSTGPGTSKFQLVAKCPKQKVRSIQFTISESTPSTGGYMAIQSLALLVGLKKPGTSFKFPIADHISSVL